MLVKDQKTRHEIPHEEGQWIEIRRVTNGDVMDIDFAGDPFAGTIKLLQRVIVGWSYEDTVSAKNVTMLDMITTKWLGDLVQAELGSDAEKNGSTTSS